MAIKNVVVVDTVGGLETLSHGYLSHFPFVKEWHGYELPQVKGQIPHPHGGMCMGQVLMPLWNDFDDIHAHFIRIFDGRGKPIGGAFGDWSINLIREISKTGDTWVNNSWGAYIGAGSTDPYKERADKWRKMINETQNVTVLWASGNSGDYRIDVDEEIPQGLLTDISDKIAAAWKNGVTAEYSSDSLNAPPTATFWSTVVKLLHPVTYEWQDASGTSFAAPKATGLCAKRGLNHQAFVDLAKTRALTGGYGGPLPHPKWGYGWLEDEYQEEIKDCPYRYDAIQLEGSISEVKDSLMWFDFELREFNNWYRKTKGES